MADQYNSDIDAGETPVTDEISNDDGATTPQGETPATDATSVRSQKGSKSAKSDAQSQAQTTTEDDGDGDGEEGDINDADVDELIFDNWIAKQPVQVQELVTRRQQALRDALVDERNQRKTLSKQISNLQRRAEGNATATKELRELRSTLEETSRRAKFYESVPTDCANPKLAYAAASMNGLVNNSGATDWDAMRQQMPELFRRLTVPSANAGTGAKQSGTATEPSMNAFIRAALGRGE